MFKEIAEDVALGVEAAAALIIAYGAAEAIVGSFLVIVGKQPRHQQRRDVWLRFAMWLLLALEFELAADIVRTAIAPSWTDIGQLGAIGVIRTFLNYFLEKDLEKYQLKDADAEETKAVKIAA